MTKQVSFEMMKKSRYLKRWNLREFRVVSDSKALVYSTSKRKNIKFEIGIKTEIRFPFGKEGLDRFQRYRVTLCNPDQSWELSHDSQTSFLKFLSKIKALLRRTRSVHAVEMFRKGKMSWNDLRLEMLRHAAPSTTSIDNEWYYYDEDDALMNEKGPFSTQEMYQRIRSDFDDDVVIEPLRVGNTRGGPYPYSTKDRDQVQDLKLALLLVMARTSYSFVSLSLQHAYSE